MQCYKKFLVIQTISDKNTQLTHDLELLCEIKSLSLMSPVSKSDRSLSLMSPVSKSDRCRTWLYMITEGVVSLLFLRCFFT